MARHTPRPSTTPARTFALLTVTVMLLSLSVGVLLAASPALQVTVTDTVATATPGDLLTYTVRVRNTGALQLDTVHARLQLSSDVVFTSASDTPTNLGGGLYEWDLATMAGNTIAFRYLTVNVKNPLAQGTLITTTIGATDLAGGATPNTATDTTTVEAPSVTLAPTSISFAAQQVGTTSTSQPVTLSNNGNQPLVINGVTASGDFSATSHCVSPLGVGASCTIDVTFTPTAAGARAGSLSVNDNAAGSPHTSGLTGQGTQPAITLNPISLDFGDQRLNTPSSARQITLTNSGSAPLKIASIAAGGEFAITNNTCPASPTTLGVNATCTVDVTFTPSALGSRSGTLTITSDAVNSPHTAPLAGKGTQPAVQLAPASLSFGSQALNTTSSTKQITLTNSGTAPLTISSITATGDFAQTNACPTTIAAGGTCVINVTFTPTALGARTGQLSIADDAPGSPHTAALDGTGLGAAVQINPASLDFGSLAVSSTSAARTVTITNTGNSNLTFTSIATSGDYAHTTTCPSGATPLAPNASCTVSVTFTPTAMGTRTGQLTFTDSAPGGAQNVALTGVGLQSALALSPTSLDFGSQRLTTTSAARRVTLTNTGNQSLNIASIAASGDYAKTATTCGAGLGPSASCTVDITFTPSATGTRSGTLTISDDAPNNPHTLALTGIGTDPQATLSPTSIDFGSHQVNTSATQTVTLSNGGVGALAISSIAISGDYTQTNNCPASLAASTSCTITITFTPAAQQTRPGTLTVTSDATSSPNTASLTGVGIQPVVSLNPTSLDFGTIAVNTTSATQAITLTNTGSQPLVLNTIATSSGFAQMNTCPVAPTTIAIGASCTITIAFTPASVGPQSGALTISSNAPSSPHTLTLAGVGSGAVYASAPAPGSVPMSSVIGLSNTISITVSNGGNQALTVSAPAGSVAAPFSITQTSGYTIQPGVASQVIGVSCAPSSVGPFTQQLTYTTNDASKPTVVYSVVCTGTAAATPAYSSSPSPGSTWTVGAALVGGSISADLTVSESGTAALTVAAQGGSAAAAITGPNASDFTIVAPASFPITIPDGGAAQQLTIRCQPSAAGARTATLSLITNDPAQPTVSYALSCTGQASPAAQTRVYLPFVAQAAAAPQAAQADLVAAISVVPTSVGAGQPVEVRVTITNQGSAAAGEFWVDLYINPSVPPTGSNQPWNQRCGLSPCYGIAWYVTQTVAPGQSITLTSTADSYYAKNTIWNGVFAPGTTDLYAYADSWNPTVDRGAVAESNEANNRGELHGLSVADSTAPAHAAPNAADLPTRPAHPAH